jgi:hypothetical protein
MHDTQPDPTPPESTRQTSLLEWFATHPVVGLIGTIASVLGVVLAVVLYLATIRARELSLYVNPPKTTIVKSGQGSDLHILYRGKDVSTDVTALQVELWNAGEESIHAEHVLSPIILETKPKVPILEVRIRHISRPVTQIVLDTAHMADGQVAVSWKILEHSAAVIQFILAGPSETSITATGALEGQPHIITFPRSPHDERTTIATALLAALAFVTLYMTWFTKGRMYRYSTDLKSRLLVSGPMLLGPPIIISAVFYFFGPPSLPIPFD